MNESVSDPLQAFREVNVEGTANLAKHAAAAGVKRFIFLSSIKVNGEFSGLGAPFISSDEPAPEDPYGVSKNEAEQALKEICAETGMEFVIIRPPLVYGPGVKANFLSMLKWLSRGVPLPLGGIRKNKRSLVYLDNLVDLIRVCIEHPNAANQSFLVSDNHDVSTYELLANTASALNAPLRLLNIPPKWLGFAGKLLGKKDIEQRLSASLQVDISHTQQMLAWEPPYSMEEGLKHTAEWFKQHRG
jgi:nucleoside-diphosphate-sugar epimerase